MEGEREREPSTEEHDQLSRSTKKMKRTRGSGSGNLPGSDMDLAHRGRKNPSSRKYDDPFHTVKRCSVIIQISPSKRGTIPSGWLMLRLILQMMMNQWRRRILYVLLSDLQQRKRECSENLGGMD